MADCPDCEKWREKGARFCGSCGQRFEENLPAKKPKGMDDIMWSLVLIGVIFGVVVIACNTLYMIANYSYFAAYAETVSVSFGMYIGITYVPFFRYKGSAMCAELIICLALQVIFLAYALYRLKAIHEKDPADYGSHLTSGMGAVIWILALDYFISVLCILTTYAVAQEAPDPGWFADYDEVFLQYELTSAGVVEELIYRMFMIGVPMMIVGFAVHRDRKSWQYVMGGFGMSKASLVLLLATSLMFGLAHYAGWGWAKIPQTFISGMLYGYLYCEYGLYASVLVHSITDTLTVVPVLGGFIGLGYIGLGFIVLIWLLVNYNKEKLDVKGMTNYPSRIENSFLQNWGRH